MEPVERKIERISCRQPVAEFPSSYSLPLLSKRRPKLEKKRTGVKISSGEEEKKDDCDNFCSAIGRLKNFDKISCLNIKIPYFPPTLKR